LSMSPGRRMTAGRHQPSRSRQRSAHPTAGRITDQHEWRVQLQTGEAGDRGRPGSPRPRGCRREL